MTAKIISLNMNNIRESNRPSALITYITGCRIFFWVTYLMKILRIYNRAIPMKGILFLNRINLSKNFCCLPKRHCQNESATFPPPPPPRTFALPRHLLSRQLHPGNNFAPPPPPLPSQYLAGYDICPLPKQLYI